MATEQFCLRWNDFHANITAAFSEIKEDEDFLDVTLVSNNDENAKIWKCSGQPDSQHMAHITRKGLEAETVKSTRP